MTGAEKVIHRLMEVHGVEDDFGDKEDFLGKDVGPPAAADEVLKSHGFTYYWYWVKTYPGGASLHVGNIEDDGLREVKFIHGNRPMWTKRMDDGEVIDMVTRVSGKRIGEAEDDFNLGSDPDILTDIEDLGNKEDLLTVPLGEWVRLSGYAPHQGGWKKTFANGMCSIDIQPGEVGQWRMASSCNGKEMEVLTGDEERIKRALIKIYDVPPDLWSSIYENEEHELDALNAEDWKDVEPPLSFHQWLLASGFNFNGLSWAKPIEGGSWILQPSYQPASGPDKSKLWTLTRYVPTGLGAEAVQTYDRTKEEMRELLLQLGIGTVNESEDGVDDEWKDVAGPISKFNVGDIVQSIHGVCKVIEVHHPEDKFEYYAIQQPKGKVFSPITFLKPASPEQIEWFHNNERKPRLGESEEDDIVPSSDVMPEVVAHEIQRWVFTEWELKHPKFCAQGDMFFADGRNKDGPTELRVCVLRDGTVTDFWEDGTVGVPDEVKGFVDMEEELVKPVHQPLDDTDLIADTWADVFVDKEGRFVEFVEPKFRIHENEDDNVNFNDIEPEPGNFETPFYQAYIEAMWFTEEEQLKESVEEAHAEGRMLDIEADKLELSNSAKITAMQDCYRFEEENRVDLDTGTSSQGGHDFWLTRNGHGAGFWDGDWPDAEGERLTTAAKEFGELWVYLGDDGLVYFSR